MKFEKIIGLNVDGVDLVQVPDYPMYWCDIKNGIIYSTHKDKIHRMNLSKDKDGYEKICLHEKGKKDKHTQAHRVLVAAKNGTWEVLKGKQVDHIKMQKDLNVEGNLRIVTKDEQYTPEMRAKMSAGKKKEMQLSDEAVRDIRKGYKNIPWGYKSKYIEMMSKKYDRRFVIIKDVLTYRTYKHVSEEVV